MKAKKIHDDHSDRSPDIRMMSNHTKAMCHVFVMLGIILAVMYLIKADPISIGRGSYMILMLPVAIIALFVHIMLVATQVIFEGDFSIPMGIIIIASIIALLLKFNIFDTAFAIMMFVEIIMMPLCIVSMIIADYLCYLEESAK